MPIICQLFAGHFLSIRCGKHLPEEFRKKVGKCGKPTE
jgi:hypothetical protein